MAQKRFYKTELGIIVSDEAKKKYLTRCQKDLLSCQKALNNKDLKVVERLGHQLSGSASTFGFNELSKIGEDIESQAEVGNMPQVSSSLKKLATTVNSLINKIN